MRFRTEKLILEGPDLTGKTSLYNRIHNKTSYKWNIQDRSALSMVCYARQYNRPDTDLRRDLYKEMTNLNNRFVILMPEYLEVLRRYRMRGDEAQDENSLSVLYRLFTEEIKPLRMLPNVLVVESLSNTNDIAESVINWLNSFESSSSLDIGNTIKQFVEESDSNEHVLTLECSGLIKSAYDESILQDPLEGKYYQEITADFCHIISKELKGLNEYGAPQDMSSRRFYYSSNSCISSLHFKPREKTLELICTFRSTDAQKNAAIDFQFLEYLVHRMKSEYFLNCSHYRIALTMNSVHLR